MDAADDQLIGAVGLLRRICAAAGSGTVCRFVYADAPGMRALFQTPSEFLRALYVNGQILAGCRNFVMACLALGMPADTTIDQRNLGDCRYGDAPIVLCEEPDKLRAWQAWMDTALPGAVVAYICDRDPEMFDFWQRVHIDFTGHWVVEYRGTTISMGPAGIEICKPIEYWKQYIVDERLRALETGLEYSGPRRTDEFMQRVKNALRPDNLTVFYYTEEKTG